jgi:hypothetical protein
MMKRNDEKTKEPLTNGMEPGKKWRFTIIGTDHNIANMKVAKYFTNVS